MPPQFLNAVIKGEEDGLQSALNDVRDAASEAASALEKAENSIEGIKEDAAVAAKSLDSVSDELEQVTGSSGTAAESTENFGDELSGTTIRAETFELSIDSLTESQAELIGATSSASQSLSREDDSAEEAADSVQGLGASLLSLAGIQTAASATSQNLSNSLDEVEDEANQATAAIAGTASMSELLSLQSSALSINVGAFTVALRNLTTQVPLLVTTLGNLTAAFTSLGGAIAGVGLGGFVATLGGAVAEVEGIAGESATLEEKFQAIQAIGEEFLSMLSEAIRPLVEMEGAAAVFKSLLEEIATTVNVFSKSIAESFTEGPLKEALGIISDAWMQSIQDIADAMQELVAKLGVPIANVMADGIRALDEFIAFVTKIGDRFMDIFGNLKDGLGTFIEELILLGLTIAEGIEPILSSFINIIGTVVENINELDNETLKTAVTVAGLFFAFNRLAGILGSIITPLALVAGTLSNIIIQANSFSQAFLLTIGSLSGGVASLSSGFGKLSNAIATAIPFITAGESNIDKLAQSMNKTGGPLSMMRRRIRGASADFSQFRFSVRGAMSNAIESIKRFAAAKTGLSTAPITDIKPLHQRGEGITPQVQTTTGFDALKVRLRSKFDDLRNVVSNGTSRASLPLSKLSLFDSDTEKADPMDRLFGFDERGLSNAASKIMDENHRVAEGLESSFTPPKSLSALEKRWRSLNLSTATDELKENFADVRSIDTVLPDDTINKELSGLRRNTDLLGSSFRKNIINRKGGIISSMQDIGASMVGTGSKSTWLGRKIILLSNVMGRNITVSTFFSRTLSGLSADLTKLGNRTGITRERLDSAALSIREFAGKEQIAADSAEDLEEHLRGVIDEAKITESKKEELNDELTELSAKSRLAGQSVDELEDELLGAGFTAEMVDGNLEEVGDEMTEMSVRASLTSAIMSLFNGVLGITGTILGGLAITLGAIVAALAAVVIIMGTAAALLMTLGSSGKSVDDIMDSLKQTLLNIADTMMPLFVASGNMMLDIVDSLVAPVKALVSGFTDIAVALGFMSQESANNASGMGILESSVKALVPVVQAVGDAFRLVFGQLTVWLRQGMDQLEQFLVSISFGDKLRESFDRIVAGIKSLIGPTKEFVNTYLSQALSVVKNLVSSALEVSEAFLGAFSLDFGSALTGYIEYLMFLFEVTIMLVKPLLKLLSSLVKAVGVLANALIDGLAAGLKAIAGIIGFVVDGIMAFISGLTGGMSGGEMMANVVAGFELIMKAIGPVVDAVVAFIDMSIAGFKVFTSILGEVWGLFTGVMGVVGQLLMPAFKALGGLIRAVFKNAMEWIGMVIDLAMNAWDSLKRIFSRDVIGGLKQLFIGGLEIIMDAVISMAENIGTVIWNALKSTLETFVSAIESIPSALLDAFESVGDVLVDSIWGPVVDFWNRNIAGKYGAGKFSIQIDEFNDPSEGNSPNSPNVNPDIDEDAAIPDHNLGEDSLTEGVDTLGDARSSDEETADESGSPSKIEYKEGDTIQNFRQNISANPEDEAQISRIAKDAMKEANSFARRQQGGQ